MTFDACQEAPGRNARISTLYLHLPRHVASASIAARRTNHSAAKRPPNATKMTRPGHSRPLRALLWLLIGWISWTANNAVARGAGPAEPMLQSRPEMLNMPLALPAPYRAGVLLIEDDPAQLLESTLVDLCRRRSGRSMIRRLLRSGFVTLMVSKPLKPMQAGLWGPIFHQGRVVGASLYIDLGQIRGLDHDATGVETLAHELRHQVDASRAFLKSGRYQAIYLAASSGDRTGSAQRYGRRVRYQSPDMTSTEARQWLLPLMVRFGRHESILMAGIATTSSGEP